MSGSITYTHWREDENGSVTTSPHNGTLPATWSYFDAHMQNQPDGTCWQCLTRGAAIVVSIDYIDGMSGTEWTFRDDAAQRLIESEWYVS